MKLIVYWESVLESANCCWCVLPLGGTTGCNCPGHILVAVHQQHCVSLFVKCFFNQLPWTLTQLGFAAIINPP